MLHNSEYLNREYIDQISKAIYFHNICFRIGWFAVRINVNKHDSCNSFPFKKGIKNNVLSTQYAWLS